MQSGTQCSLRTLLLGFKREIGASAPNDQNDRNM